MRAIKGIMVLLVCLTLIVSVGSQIFHSITIPSSGQVQVGSDLPLGTKIIETSFENERLPAPQECGQGGLYVPNGWADADVGDGDPTSKMWYIDESDSRAPLGGFPDGSHGIYAIVVPDAAWSTENFLMMRNNEVTRLYVRWWQRFETFPAQGDDYLPIFWVTGMKLDNSDAVIQYTVPYISVSMGTGGLNVGTVLDALFDWNLEGSVPASAIQADVWYEFEFSLVLAEQGSCTFSVDGVKYVDWKGDSRLEPINAQFSDFYYSGLTGFEVGIQFPAIQSSTSYEYWLDDVLAIGSNAPDIFEEDFESVPLGTRTDNEGGTDGHGIVQDVITHSGSHAWKLWGLRETLWTDDTMLECVGGPYDGQIKRLGDIASEVAADSKPGTYQFADGGNGYPKLMMMNPDGSLPSGYVGPPVPNDGLYHWTVSNGYPRGRIGTGDNIPAYDDVYLRVYFYLERLDGYVQILRLWAPSGASTNYIAMVAVSQGDITIEGVGGEFKATADVTLNEWHYLEMRFKVGTSDGIKQVWFDDPETPIIDAQNLDTSGAMGASEYTPLTGLVLAGTYPNCELTFYIDDFAASRDRAYYFGV
jgi:hypothetical protein